MLCHREFIVFATDDPRDDRASRSTWCRTNNHTMATRLARLAKANLLRAQPSHAEPRCFSHNPISHRNSRGVAVEYPNNPPARSVVHVLAASSLRLSFSKTPPTSLPAAHRPEPERTTNEGGPAR